MTSVRKKREREWDQLVARSIGRGKSNGRDMDISEARNPFACPSLRRGVRSRGDPSCPRVLRVGDLADPSSRDAGHRVRLRSV